MLFIERSSSSFFLFFLQKIKISPTVAFLSYIISTCQSTGNFFEILALKKACKLILHCKNKIYGEKKKFS